MIAVPTTANKPPGRPQARILAAENRGADLSILARILRDRGVVTERQLQEAIQHQVLYGGRLGTSLFELGFITEERLQAALSRAHGVPGDPVDLREIQPEAVALVSKAVASRHKVFPYRIKGKTLFLLMVDPRDHGAVAKISFSLGYIVKPIVVPEFRMVQLLRDYYEVDERWRFTDTQHPKTAPTVPLTPTEAAARLDEATTREEIVESILGVSQGFFRRVVFFIVREPWVVGWTGSGEGMDKSLAGSLRIPLDQPSMFRTVTRDKTVFVGRFGPDEENQRFLKAIAKRPNTNAALLPIVVKSRVVNLIYGDSGPSGNIKANLGELLVLLQKAPRAYLRIIRKRIEEAQKAGAPGPLPDAGETERAKEHRA